MQPLVSIIIPTFNRSRFIGETLDSVLSQIYHNWECIVVDDGSTDVTEKLMGFYCEKDSRITFYHRPEDRPKGANACRNFGLEMSKGEFVQWFDSDDVLNNFCLKKKIGFLLSYRAEVCVCNSNYFIGNNKQTVQTFINYSNSSNLLIDYLSGKININIPSILWKRSFLGISKFDENLNRAQELDFHFRLLKNKAPKVVFIDEALVSVRSHQDSITGAYKKGDLGHSKAELKVCRDIIDYIGNSNFPLQKKNKCLKRYLDGLRNLYRLHSLKEVRKEIKMAPSFLKGCTEYAGWRRNFLLLVVLYKISGREYRLKNHLYKLKFHG